MFSQLSVPMLLIEDSSRVIALNPAAARLFKMEPEELEGQFWSGLDGQLNQIIWKKRLRELEDKGSFVYNTDLVTSDELLRPVEVEMVRTGEGLTLIYLHNLLAEGIDEADLELMSNDGNVGFWMYNRVDDVLYMSPYLRELAGLDESKSAREVAYQLQERILPSDWDRIRPQVKELLDEAGAFDQLLHFTGSRGTMNLRFFAQSSGNALHVTRLFGMIRQENDLIATDHVDSISGELAAFSIDQAKDLIFWTRPDGTVPYANQAASDLLGYTREELQKMHAGAYTIGFKGERVEAWWEKMRSERADQSIWEVVDKEGNHYLLDASITYLRFGKEEYTVGFCRNITELEIARRRQAILEFTLDHSKELILWLKEDGTIHFVNETFLERTGADLSDIEGKHISMFLDLPDEHIRQEAKARLESGETLTGEMELKLMSGKKLAVKIRISNLTYGGEVYSCIYLQDMTAKRERDIQLKLSAEALDSAADCILWLNVDLRINYINGTLLDLIGRKREDIIGAKYSKVFPQLDQKSIFEEQTLNIDVISNSGEELTINLNVSRITDNNQSFFMLVGRDMTGQREREQSLETAYEEIRRLKDNLEDENVTLREEVGSGYNVNNIITVSPKYKKVLHQIGQVADVDTTVLITGETGTGKELLARAIHQLSERSDQALIKVNCAALPENLIESELFGHEKGAYTGAVGRKRGRFEMADGGTLFLDEIGELPLDLQSKLLRALQEGEFERLGGTETLNVDVRLVAATNRNLQEMVRQGSFRADLYYRLNVFPIENMALRERPEDIPVLVEHFTRKFAKRQNKKVTKINSSDLAKLKKYSFPGNIRELENLVERAVVLCNSETLSIPLNVQQEKTVKGEAPFLQFEEMQRQHIINALIMTEGRVTGPNGAGVILGLNDRTLVSKMRKLDIKKIDYLKAYE
ncbi:PAS domain S-box protein [Neolewinella aurantiaca]|uniref:PAS domain S-box protein n=1 Tax=Neolewinella aurantiaca TaxID=2602767 RepID=A0A5C7FL49_9BACT|nr:sigma 54-interacting transcriptional regulator [Neolewinella aurantiaca]TXF90763.1 PAS domain S-box protein [Neolewinella aurantiaca]